MTIPTVRAAVLATLALVLAGCSGDQEKAAGSPAPTVAVASSPVASASVSASPAPSSPAPCQETKNWSERQTVNWVRAMFGTDSSNNVVFGQNKAVATVCKGVPVKVEFWRVVLTNSVTNVSYTVKSAQRSQVSIDGRRPVTVKAPKNFEARDCAATLTAVYLGKPLTENELPGKLDVEGPSGGPAEFNTDRVAQSVLIMPNSDNDFRSCHL
jgi:hypothetical protein